MTASTARRMRLLVGNAMLVSRLLVRKVAGVLMGQVAARVRCLWYGIVDRRSTVVLWTVHHHHAPRQVLSAKRLLQFAIVGHRSEVPSVLKHQDQNQLLRPLRQAVDCR